MVSVPDRKPALMRDRRQVMHVAAWAREFGHGSIVTRISVCRVPDVTENAHRVGAFRTNKGDADK